MRVFKSKVICPGGQKSKVYFNWQGILILVFVITLSGCSDIPKFEVADNVTCKPNQMQVGVVGDEGDKEFCVQVADDDIERVKGLMYVESMPENEGMLFVFDDEDYRSFWMMNTLIPLDILFFDADGKLVDIKNDFQPCESNLNCKSYQAKEKAMYVLEVNSGIYSDLVKGLELVF